MDFDKEKVSQWLQEHWIGHHKCEVCGNNNWVLLDNVWELRKFQGGSLVLGGPDSPIMPVIALMCNVCGYLKFFNAIATRAVKKPGAKDGQHE